MGPKSPWLWKCKERKGRPYLHAQVRRPLSWKVHDVASISAGEQTGVSKR